MVARLPNSGVDVVALGGPSSALIDWFRAAGTSALVRSDSFPGEPRGRHLWPRWQEYQKGRALRREVAEVIRTQRIDVVLASLPFAWAAVTPVAERLGVPIIWRAGGTLMTRAQRALLWSYTRAYRPQLLVCCSAGVERVYAPICAAPSTVVLNGVDERQFYPGARARDLRPAGARFVVGLAARLVPSKRPQDFVELAARLGRRFPSVRLLVAGDGARRQEYEHLARSIGAGNLTFLGFVDDMPSFYAACDALVLPSRGEGCPNCVLEAMAMGKVVVASDVSGTNEVLRHGIEGLLYPCGDLTKLTAAVASLIENPTSYAALAAASSRRVAQEFNARTAAARLAVLVERVVEEWVPTPARRWRRALESEVAPLERP
jgi:glycosyltransferase involved in cell wall biosynthesis